MQHGVKQFDTACHKKTGAEAVSLRTRFWFAFFVRYLLDQQAGNYLVATLANPAFSKAFSLKTNSS
jgi:hypothetical protein